MKKIKFINGDITVYEQYPHKQSADHFPFIIPQEGNIAYFPDPLVPREDLRTLVMYKVASGTTFDYKNGIVIVHIYEI